MWRTAARGSADDQGLRAVGEVGVPRRVPGEGNVNREVKLRAELVAVGERLYRAGLLRAGEGNFSARLDAATFLLTPRDCNKGLLQSWELVRAPLAGDLPATASSEGLLHQAILRTDPSVGAVLHAHLPWVLRALGCGQGLSTSALKEAGSLRLVVLRDLPPGSQALAEAAAAAVARGNVLLLPTHGVVVVGTSVQEALWRLETTELVAFVSQKGVPHV